MKGVLEPNAFRRLCAARDRLREPIEPSPTVKAIAKEAAMSPYHFIRVFTALFGETPHQLRTRARVDRAKSLLALRNDDVTDVCFDLGFTSLGSFSDLFARRVGAPPSAFRRRARAAMTSPDQLPAEMIPGCISLMSGPKEVSQFSRSAAAAPRVRLRSRHQKPTSEREKA